MAFSTIGPQFGGRKIRTHVELPIPPLPLRPEKLRVHRMPTSDLKVAQAILSEELRLIGSTVNGWTSLKSSKTQGWNATRAEVCAMRHRLAEIGEEITRRNLRDLANGKVRWTRPRRSSGGLSVSLAEVAKVH